MAEPAITVNEFRVGSVLGRGFSILFSNIVPFGLLSLLVNLPIIIIPFAFINQSTTGEIDSLASAVGVLLTLTLYFLLDFLVTAALTYGTFQELRGRRASIGDCIGRGLSLIFPILGVAIVSGLATMAGFIALVIPGFIVMTMLWVVIPVALLENLGVFASLKRSAELTKGYRWGVFGIIILVGIIQNVVAKIGEMVLGEIDSMVTAELIALLPEAFFTALWAVVIAVGYHDLRVTKEGIGAEEIAAVFD